jgi:hydroxymethylbilane synthase
VRAERAFLRALGGGCLAPAAALATVHERTLRVRAAVGDPDGAVLLREAAEGPLEDGEALGEDLARRLLARGAAEILRRAREGAAGGA